MTAFTRTLFTRKFESIFSVADFAYKNTHKLRAFLYISKRQQAVMTAVKLETDIEEKRLFPVKKML